MTVGPEHEVAVADRAFAEPEVDLLGTVLGDEGAASRLARAPGGWRTLSEHELAELGFGDHDRGRVKALQVLVQRTFGPLPKHAMLTSADVARTYAQRLGGHVREVFLVVALNGQNELMGEVEVATGALHHVSITPAQLFRPLIRLGASACILVHNHPGGNPTPSEEDIALTRQMAEVGKHLGINVIDHVIIAARGGGYASLLAQGVL